jgi:hypothetical protein
MESLMMMMIDAHVHLRRRPSNMGIRYAAILISSCDKSPDKRRATEYTR